MTLDIVFCEACDGSISTHELEAGRAVRVEGRLFHLECAPEAARARRVWNRYLAFLLLPPVLGLGYLLGRTLPPTNTNDARDPDLAPRIAKLENEVQLVGRDVVALAQLLGAVRADGATLRADLAGYREPIERLGEGMDALADLMGRVAEEIGDFESTPTPPDSRERERRRVERALEDLREHEDEGVRFSAIRTLALADDPRALRAIRAGLQDGAASVRAYAAANLGALKDIDSGAALVSMLGDEDRAVRDAVYRALRMISSRDFPFDALAREEDRRKAQAAWEKWWRESQATDD